MTLLQRKMGHALSGLPLGGALPRTFSLPFSFLSASLDLLGKEQLPPVCHEPFLSKMTSLLRTTGCTRGVKNLTLASQSCTKWVALRSVSYLEGKDLIQPWA